MTKLTPIITKLGAAGALATLVRRTQRRRNDPVRAPGHRHRPPPPAIPDPTNPDIPSQRDQPWIRRSHSDSQQRRFRR